MILQRLAMWMHRTAFQLVMGIAGWFRKEKLLKWMMQETSIYMSYIYTYMCIYIYISRYIIYYIGSRGFIKLASLH